MSPNSDQYSNRENNAVVIVAAGRGSRMGSSGNGPKQYRSIGETSVLDLTIQAFVGSSLIEFVQVVIHPDDEAMYREKVTPHAKLRFPVFGGKTRQESAFAGLKALGDLNIGKVLIHDGARPFVNETIISNVIDAIQPKLCVIPALPITETVKKACTEFERVWALKTISRDDLYLAQTPQGFIFNEIMGAHNEAALKRLDGFTDDASVAEAFDTKVLLVPGDRENIKITTLNDLEFANNMNNLNNKTKVPDVRTGNGYDIHRLVDGDQVILCGIALPFNKKLDGHSDADVGLHALTDALLGAIGDGDIGSHFPPSDAKWRGAASDQFLAHACELVRQRSGIITHMDVTLICEMPKIGPHRDKMREKIASICDVEVGRIAVKATTNEAIGSIGRGEGIAAIATATVVIQA